MGRRRHPSTHECRECGTEFECLFGPPCERFCGMHQYEEEEEEGNG